MSQTKTQLVEGFNINTSAPADALAIDNNGRVGIGTSSPSYRLHVKSPGNGQHFISGQNSSGTDIFRVYESSTGDGQNGIVYLFDGAGNNDVKLSTNGPSHFTGGNVGIGTTSPSEALHIVGKIAVSGTNPSIKQVNQTANLDLCGGTAVGTDSSIQLYASSSPSDANHSFYNSNVHIWRNAAGTTQYGRFDSSGRLGIGTSSPEQPLHVENPSGEVVVLIEGNESSAGAGGVLVLKNNNTGANNLNQIQGADAGGQTCSAISFTNVDQANNEGELRFLTRPSGGNPTERFRFGSAGQLGIGGATYGTSGQVLTSQGSGSAPQWASVSTGNDYNFASGNATGTTINITGIPSNALKIEVIFGGIGWTQTAGFFARVGSGSFQTSGYTWNQGYVGSSTSFSAYTGSLFLNNGYMTTAERIYGKLVLDQRTVNTWGGVYEAMSSNFGGGIIHGVGDAPAGGTLDRIQLAMTAGSFSTGYYTVNVYTE